MKIRFPLALFITASLLLNSCGTLELQLETPVVTPQSPVSTIQNPVITSQSPEAAEVTTPATNTPLPPALDPTVESTPAPIMADAIDQIDMIDSAQGWATSRPGDTDMRILRTTDGGSTWQDVTPDLTQPANGVSRRASAYFRNAEQAWITYEDQPTAGNLPEGFVWFTTDGGKSWSKSQPLDFNGVQADFYSPSDLGFMDEQHGWLIAHIQIDMKHDYFAVFTSENGGTTWQRQVDPVKDAQLMLCLKTGLTFVDPKVGWLTGDCGGESPGVFLYRTENGGNTWNPVSLEPPSSQVDVYSNSDELCRAEKIIVPAAQAAYLPVQCGSRSTQQVHRWIYVSNNPASGEWILRDAPEVYGYFDFIDESTGWMSATQQGDPSHPILFRTDDGAQSWTKAADIDWYGKADFIDAQNGWAITSNPAGASLIMRTMDGGVTWQKLNSRIVEPSTAFSSASGYDLTLQYDSSLISSATVQKFPEAADANAPYWQILPQYTQITLNGYPIADHAYKPEIFLYPVEEYEAINETAGKVIEGLKSLLESKPGEGTGLPLPVEQSAPFLPLDNVQQLIHARVKVFAFQNGHGISYLTQFGQSYAPIRSQELIYTYQGLTSDGKYYVSAILPVILDSLPSEEALPAGTSPSDYYAEITRQLDQEAPSNFSPNLDQLDEMLGSIEVK